MFGVQESVYEALLTELAREHAPDWVMGRKIKKSLCFGDTKQVTNILTMLPCVCICLNCLNLHLGFGNEKVK